MMKFDRNVIFPRNAVDLPRIWRLFPLKFGGQLSGMNGECESDDLKIERENLRIERESVQLPKFLNLILTVGGISRKYSRIITALN